MIRIRYLTCTTQRPILFSFLYSIGKHTQPKISFKLTKTHGSQDCVRFYCFLFIHRMCDVLKSYINCMYRNRDVCWKIKIRSFGIASLLVNFYKNLIGKSCKLYVAENMKTYICKYCWTAKQGMPIKVYMKQKLCEKFGI